MVNGAVCGINCFILLITPIVRVILFLILLTFEFHFECLFIISPR